jgi:hypothetical protein
MILNSIVKSKRMIVQNDVEDVIGTVEIPNKITLADKTFEELKNLTITKFEWYNFKIISFTLSNGESCTAGSDSEVIDSKIFDPNKKITRVEMIFDKYNEFFT